MAMNILREDLQTTSVVCQKYHRTTADTDAVIPDSKPDIQKVLDVSGYAHITGTEQRGDKIRVEGKVVMTLLYLSDDEENRVQTLSATADFQQSFDCAREDADLQILAEAEPESFDSSILNSRKVNLRCSLGLQIKATAPVRLSPIVQVEDAEGLSLKTEQLHLLQSTDAVTCQWILREQPELPGGKPAIAEILRVSAEPATGELCMMEEKALIKGDVKLCILYLARDEEQSIQCMEHTLPFTEILDIPGSNESMEGEIDYSVQDIYCELREDSDGEPRVLGVELLLGATLRGVETIEPCMVTDAYSGKCELLLSFASCTAEQLLDKRTAELSVKDSVQIPSGLPALQRICSVTATAKTEKIVTEDGQISIYGKVMSHILYLSADKENPVSCFRHVSEFSHHFPAPETSDDIVCDARVCVSHCSYTLNGENALSLQFVLGLTVKALSVGEITLVENIEESADPLPALPCMALYFVQKGDTLWDIAKRYRTTVDALKRANNLQDDTIYPGQQLKIRTMCA